MEMDDYATYLKAFRSQAETLQTSASARKGQKARNKPSKVELKFRHEQSRPRLGAQSGGYIRNTIIGAAYPPSTVPISDLSPISTSDLRLETHHRGKVLIVRTFADPYRMVAISNVIESVDGDVDRLAVYNVSTQADPSDILPMGAVLAVKEPYYKSTADGGATVRVDHPCDLVELSPGHELIPKKWQQANPVMTAEQYKTQGNAAVKRKEYAKACKLYTLGLKHCSSSDGSIKADLYRNRALTYLVRGLYEQAIEDCKNAIVPTNENDASDSGSYNVKALYRAGSAAYKLRKFGLAAKYFEEALAIHPEDDDSRRELSRTMSRILEENEGKYDLEKLQRGQKVQCRVDCADYTSQTEVRQAKDKGRGLFATCPIPTGAIIMCEKAFDVAFESDEATSTYILLNVNTNRASVGTHVNLLFSLVHKLSSNPVAASRYFDLYDGNYGGDAETQIVDGVPVIDTFRTQQIAEFNGFGCGSDAERKRKEHIDSKTDVDSAVGVWIQASYMNHDCLGNAARAFIGDMMVVRATRAIAKDEEIFIRYVPPDPVNTKTQEKLKTTWGFHCTCRICAAEASSTPAQRRDRKTLQRDIATFLAQNRLTKESRPSRSLIGRGERLYGQASKAYDAKIFQGVPRLCVLSIGEWLCQAYSFASSPEQMIEFAIRLLGETGIVVGRDASGRITFDRKGGSFGIMTADFAMYAANACFAQGQLSSKLVDGEAFVRLAKQLYTECEGGLGGFEERYGRVDELAFQGLGLS